MKNLKKFNENWIDDESEDTNRRMAELDAEEGINKPADKTNSFEDEFLDKLFNFCHEYKDKLSVPQFSDIFWRMYDYYSEMEYNSRKK